VRRRVAITVEVDGVLADRTPAGAGASWNHPDDSHLAIASALLDDLARLDDIGRSVPLEHIAAGGRVLRVGGPAFPIAGVLGEYSPALRMGLEWLTSPDLGWFGSGLVRSGQ
jgi:hypothetical protein